MNVQMAQNWLFIEGEFICTSIDENYFALLSVIYNLQGGKTAQRLESDHLQECVLNSQGVHWPHPVIIFA